MAPGKPLDNTFNASLEPLGRPIVGSSRRALSDQSVWSPMARDSPIRSLACQVRSWPAPV